jgi:hypothetical protein
MSDHLYLIDEKKVFRDGDINDKVVYYSSKFNEYGIPIGDDVSYISIEFCPWCGSELPESLRERWFYELELLGYEEPLSVNNYPEKYKSSKWWKE